MQDKVLQASTNHEEHGIVVAAPFKPFDGTRCYDVPYVRAERTRMLQWLQQNRAGFGLDFGIDHLASIEITETNIALYRFELRHNVDLLLQVRVAEGGSFLQRVLVTNNTKDCVLLPYALQLNVSLNRASYGQLTEGGPIPLPPSRNLLRRVHESTVRVHNPHLRAQLTASLTINGQPLDLRNIKDQDRDDSPVDFVVHNTVCIPPGEAATFLASFQLLSDTEDHVDSPPSSLLGGHAKLENRASRWKLDELCSTYVLRRNIQYILANCAVPVSDTVIAIVADHVALPLGWNRDNYWQIRLLFEAHANIASLMFPQSAGHYKAHIKSTITGHINWVFHKAERPYGFWHRSYLVNGRPKDRSIFQLDQQCYPLLELCDYLEYFPEEAEAVKAILGGGVIDEVLGVIQAKQDVHTKLWSTDETPGDDAVLYPHHFSSHVLLWRTFTRLHQLLQRLGALSEGIPLEAVAADIRRGTIETFTTTHPSLGKQIFAYLTDGDGKYTFYHDANDVPTLFARDWGFVSTPEEVSTWKNTMHFGLSPANEAGYCNEGPYRGLGSVHSPGAWSLGYFQELAYFASANDAQAMQAAWKKISAAMQWDGTFSEAVDPVTAECTSKAWFSWPGAMIGALLIRMRLNGQEEILLKDSGN